MKSYKFSLQAVLTLREEQEQSTLRAYAKMLLACERADSALEEAEEELTSGWSALQRQLQREASAAELLQLHNFCAALEQRCQEREQEAQVARNQAREAFAQFLLARQARTVLERCSEKEKTRFEQARRKHEQKQLDSLFRRPSTFTPLDEQSLHRN